MCGHTSCRMERLNLMNDASIQQDDTTEDQMSPEWVKIETIQNNLAKALRQHDAGKQIEASEVLSKAMAMIAEEPAQTAETKAPPDIASGAIDYWAHVAKRKTTVETGIKGLNIILGGGLEPQRLMVVLGAPGSGKTTLVNQMAVHAADKGRPVFYVTSEDIPFNLLAKTLARQGQISYTAVLKGYEEQQAKIKQALEDYQESKAATRLRYLDATMGTSLSTVRERAQAHFEAFKDGGSGILVIDYLQRLARSLSSYRTGKQDLRLAVTALSEELRALASGLDCTVIALAAQQREAYKTSGSRNSLASGKESGDIEYTADTIMAIVDDDQRTMQVPWLQAKVLRVDKNRQGPAGDNCIVNLDWYSDKQKFTEAFEESETEKAPSSNGRQGGRR
jgi:replicative DNA helicase